MVCKSDHSDIQIVSKAQISPPGDGNDGGLWSYVSQGIGYVAISLAVVGELIGAHEMAVAIVDKAARVCAATPRAEDEEDQWLHEYIEGARSIFGKP